MSPVWRKVVAAAQVVGGLAGLWSTALVMGQFPPGARERILLSFVITAYLVSLAAGVLLWRDTLAGWVLTAIVQLVQLPKVASVPLTFLFTSGVDVAFGVGAKPGPAATDRALRLDLRACGAWLDFRLGASYQVHVNNPAFRPGLGLSLVSLAVLASMIEGRSRLPAGGGIPPVPGEPVGASIGGAGEPAEQFRQPRTDSERAKQTPPDAQG
jgi:hypothetical protein